MLRTLKWLVVLSAAAITVVTFGTALADPGVPTGDGGWGPGMHGQMDQQAYGEMIQHMTEVHGAEVTAEMLQRMNEGGDCHALMDGDSHPHMGAGMMGSGMMGLGMMGSGMMSGRFAGMHGVSGLMRSIPEMMNGMFQESGVPNRSSMGGMMGR